MLKCVSLYGPWAHLMRAGAKANETRGWSTRYRGDIAIHAGKVCDREMAMDDRVVRALADSADTTSGDRLKITLPAGAVLCVVELYDCVPSERIVADLMSEELNSGNPEIHFGDYSPAKRKDNE